MDPRNSLVFEFMRLVLEIDPKTFVFENVPGLMSMVTPEGENVVDAITRIAEDGGFGHREELKKALLTGAGLGAAHRGRNAKPRSERQIRLDEADDGGPESVQLELPQAGS